MDMDWQAKKAAKEKADWEARMQDGFRCVHDSPSVGLVAVCVGRVWGRVWWRGLLAHWMWAAIQSGEVSRGVSGVQGCCPLVAVVVVVVCCRPLVLPRCCIFSSVY